MTETSRVLAFDIGIKNLAWCLLEKKQTIYTIIDWDNYNLLSESSNMSAKKKTCQGCSAKAGFDCSGLLFCARHCPASQPVLRDLSGTILKKLPKATVCKDLLGARGVLKPPKKIDQIVQELSKHYSLPITEKKVAKAPDVGLIEIHNSIQKLIKEKADLWKSATLILLENQPAFKNPTMKSVQILLFATLRDFIPNCPPLKLVHAGKKVKDAAKGDAGYKDRKAGSEARATTFFTTYASPQWQQKYSSASKKSDLADALCMCIDATS